MQNYCWLVQLDNVNLSHPRKEKQTHDTVYFWEESRYETFNFLKNVESQILFRGCFVIGCPPLVALVDVIALGFLPREGHSNTWESPKKGSAFCAGNYNPCASVTEMLQELNWETLALEGKLLDYPLCLHSHTIWQIFQ